jgi:hypothetical protein
MNKKKKKKETIDQIKLTEISGVAGNDGKLAVEPGVVQIDRIHSRFTRGVGIAQDVVGNLKLHERVDHLDSLFQCLDNQPGKKK